MKPRNPKSLSIVLGVSATLAMIPQVSFSSLMLEPVKKSDEAAVTAPVVINNEAFSATEQVQVKAPAIIHQQAPAAAAQPQIIYVQVPAAAPAPAAPMYVPAPTGDRTRDLDMGIAPSNTPSKTLTIREELIRKQQENDLLMQRILEEKRLEAENELAERLLTKPAPKQDTVVVSQAAPEAPAVVIEKNVMVAPVTAVTAPTGGEYSEERTRMSVSPRAGLSTMSAVSGFDIQSRYSAGVNLGVESGENLSFELGYTFSEYGVAMASTNPWVAQAAMYSGTTYNGNISTVAMKQNVLNAGLKVNMLGNESKLRPFIGGGAGYSKGFINYDPSIISNLTRMGVQGLSNDYEVSSMLGYLTAGVDVKVAKNITVGLVTQYYKVLTSRENQNLNNAAFTGGYNPYASYGAYSPYGYGAYADQEKQVLGGSLSKASFYSIMGNVTFTF